MTRTRNTIVLLLIKIIIILLLCRFCISCSWTGADPSEGNDENKEYNCVLRSRLASHSLVYGAEVDGVDPRRYNPPHAHLTPFVELKTTKEVNTDRERQILHKFKFQKWWCQSFLVGIPRVICGYRDDAGVVRTVQTFAVSNMPNQCQVSDCNERSALKKYIGQL